MPSAQLPPPVAAFHANASYRNQVQEILSRREAQRRTIAFSDPEKLKNVPLSTISQEAREAFRASCAETELNSMRNRYSDIVPYDATRVVLNQVPNEQSYINASWLKEPTSASSPKAARTWIASQAPTKHTIHDFLSLFLHSPGSSVSDKPSTATTPKVILMLTACREGGREKSARYWPKAPGESITVPQFVPTVVESSTSRYSRPEVEWQEGPQTAIEVTFVSSTPSSAEDERQHRGWRTNELSLSSGNRKTSIYQIEYLGWQDHGVPESSTEVLQLLEHVEKLLAETSEDGVQSSLVTHCSAGVGRTGSFIAIAWLAKIMQDLLQSSQAGLEALQAEVEKSPLGPLPAVPLSGTSSTTKEKARGLLPSFLHKDDKEGKNTNGQTQTSDRLKDFDFVMATIDRLRDQRTTMVQTPKQVEFVYEVAKTWWEANAK